MGHNTGTREKTIFTDADHDCIWPAVSPDGNQLVHYLRRHTDRPLEFLAIADSSGENDRELCSTLDISDDTVIRPAGFPQWSPDGSEIAWMRTVLDRATNETTWEILFVSSDGRQQRRLPLDETFRWGYFDWVQ